MEVGLQGKILLITGAARGIGAAIARAAAQSGAQGLVLTDLDDTPTNLPCPIEAICADLADPLSPDMILAVARGRFGRIDGLVNAAGLTLRGGFDDPDVAFWNRMFSVNTRAPFMLMAGVIKDLKARGAPGSIVNIQSMNAHCGAPDLAVYAATKGALQTLTKNAANGHMADRIRVNGINLGWVATQSEDHMQSVVLGKGPGWQEEAATTRPLGRLVDEAEAARLALYLLSEASAPMTGVNLDLEQQVVGAP